MKIYDIETAKSPEEVEGSWQNPEGMGFGTAVMYDDAEDQYFFYAPNDKELLIQALTGFEVVTFNGIKFDNAVLLGEKMAKNTPWVDRDLLLEVVRAKYGVNTVKEAEESFGPEIVHDGSIGLNGLAKGTLGMHKISHGSKSPKMIQTGQWAEVFAYNLHDVRLTKLLVFFAQNYGYLIDGSGQKIEVPMIITWE
jgi:hypothetical protein